TALMEAGIRNLVRRGGSSLHLVCGAFSERWAEIARLVGRKPELLAVPWGQAHAPAMLREKLLTSPPFEAVCITHNETSTGVIEPLRELAAVVREVSPETLVLADAVSSLGGAPLSFDECGLDLAFAGTQKCLALPPGLTVYALSRRALDRAGKVDERGFLFDFVRAVPETEAGKTLATPCIPLVLALGKQLDRVLAEGLEQRWARHVILQHTTLAWAQQWQVELFVADPAARSPTVSCLLAGGRDLAAMANKATAAGFKLDQGYGQLKGKAFRIGHFGDHTPERLQQFLKALQ
ncbi:MAG TPA: aminotransferase class V-fold PLP-dependent enzyme, partial [Planctomycetota bacterium]|nr:aminotransferase class V-fold PLP-dependent enzyme [Planctomycetota bacterium]